MKLPIPQELVDQLSDTSEKMGQIVDGLGLIAEKLDRLIELEEARQ